VSLPRQSGNAAASFLCSCTTAGEIKLFGFISGGLGGIWFPAVDFVIAGTFVDQTFATASSLLRFSR